MNPDLVQNLAERWLPKQDQFADFYRTKPACIHYIDAEHTVRRLNLVTQQREIPERLNETSVHSVFVASSSVVTDTTPTSADWEMVQEQQQDQFAAS